MHLAKAYALACCMFNVYALAYAPAGCLLPVQSLPRLAREVNCARPWLGWHVLFYKLIEVIPLLLDTRIFDVVSAGFVIQHRAKDSTIGLQNCWLFLIAEGIQKPMQLSQLRALPLGGEHAQQRLLMQVVFLGIEAHAMLILRGDRRHSITQGRIRQPWFLNQILQQAILNIIRAIGGHDNGNTSST